ncbi:MAG: hypothetical protein GX270_10175 [Clostridiaceae bacterium]|nr:hypothetical protein [Clostridiaceae bacterium]
MYRLTLNSPLIICEEKVDSNFVKSVDYIPGNRVRAAFAKEILLQCPLFQKDKKQDGKYNWVSIRDQDKCKECDFFNLCSNFGKIRFSFFYPEGTQVIPLSAERYKCSKCKGFKDGLIKKDKNLDYSSEVCKICDGRIESVYGLRKGKYEYKLPKIMLEKTAIDSFTLTSRDKQLYTLVAVTEAVKKKDGIEKTRFVGSISMQDSEIQNFSIKPICDLRVGAYNSVGFGKVNIEGIDAEEVCDIHSRIEEFNKRIVSLKNEINGNYIYIPILFNSHAKLGIERIPHEKLSSRDIDFKAIWKELITEEYENNQIIKRGLNFEFEVEKVYTETQIYRGYDTSLDLEEPREKAIIINKMGTTVLLKIHKNEYKKAIENLSKAEQLGIGYETENGYGQVEISNEIHLKGEI